MLCIAIENHGSWRQRGWLQWVLTPSGASSTEEIKAKIKSKMEIAKLLSVFITTGTRVPARLINDKEKADFLAPYMLAVYVSAACFFAAVGLYLATMYAYDTLLMPHRFWGASPPKDPRRRPRWLVRRTAQLTR